MQRRSLAARILRTAAVSILATAAASVFAVAAFRWLPVPMTSFMVGERLAARAEDKPLGQKQAWVPWERISPHAAVAVIAAADQRGRPCAVIDHADRDIYRRPT